VWSVVLDCVVLDCVVLDWVVLDCVVLELQNEHVDAVENWLHHGRVVEYEMSPHYQIEQLDVWFDDQVHHQMVQWIGRAVERSVEQVLRQEQSHHSLQDL
jgi:hypothetical protein